MLRNIVTTATRVARDSRALLSRSSAKTNLGASTRAGSDVAHHDELTPRQEEELNKRTYDFQSTPAGSFEEGYARQQAYYNKWLYAGIASFVVTIILGRILRPDMYWIAPELPRTNPPLFTMKQMEAEALEKLESGEEDED